jgi:hypothetical protein
LAAAVQEGELALAEAVAQLDRRLAERAMLRERVEECLRYLSDHMEALAECLRDPGFREQFAEQGGNLDLAQRLATVLP